MSIIIFNFLAHISVILSLNHVLLWDNVKVNVKKNSEARNMKRNML